VSISILDGQEHVERLLAGPAPAWILKHSSTCPTSSAALDEVEAYLATHPDEIVGMVVVQEDRPLSNWIAQRLGRVHQSPQLFLLAGGAIAWSASHWSINATAMATERGKLG
jgi:bacillithiol system protein YtxJ